MGHRAKGRARAHPYRHPSPGSQPESRELANIHDRCGQRGLNEHIDPAPSLSSLHAMPHLRVGKDELDELLSISETALGGSSRQMIGDLDKQCMLERVGHRASVSTR